MSVGRPSDAADETGSRTRTLTLLCVDLAGSTHLIRTHGDDFPQVLRQFHALVRKAVASHGGRVERTDADLVLCVFTDAMAAIGTAHDIQSAMVTGEWPGGSVPRARIGIHTGSLSDAVEGPEVARAVAIGSAAQPGQVLVSDATRRLIEDDARRRGWLIFDLGTFTLADQGERLIRVDFPDLPAALAPPRARPRVSSRLPVPASPIIGRSADLQGAANLLRRDGVRLVTLTGPGGTGKTRLAIELAHQLEPEFADGGVFVDLAAVRSPEQALAVTARALGIFEGPDRGVLEGLATVAGESELLLVLDNMEQVENSAGPIGDILEALGRSKVLATSRSPIRTAWEHEYPLAPLPVPTEVAGHDAILASDAVTLLVERASGVRPGFTVTAANEAAVAEITRRLDGLPLAIELAATRLRILTPELLLQRLDDRLGMLDKGPADAPERHRTLRAAVQWSHDMLDDDERALFRRLGVFSGGFPLDAVTAVCAADESDDPLGTLEELVAKSLVVFELGPDGEPRYRLLETLREFAVEQLRGSGEEAAIRERHVDWCHGLANRVENELATPFFPGLLDVLERERHNLGAAFAWCLASGTGVEKALETCGRLSLFWDTRGFVAEGLDWTERLLAAAGTGVSPGRAVALSTVGWLAMLAGDPERSLSALAESDVMWRQIGDPAKLCRTLAMRGMTSYNVGLLDEAEAQFDEAIELARNYAEMEWIADAWCPYGMAHIALARGDVPETLRLLLQVLDYSKSRGLTWGVGHAQLSLGVLAFMSGDPSQAATRLTESLLVREQLRDARGICDCLGMMALLASSQGDQRLAAVLLGAAQVRREASGHSPVPWQQPLLDSAAAASSGALGNAYDEAVAEGRALGLDEAIKFAVDRTGALTGAPASVA